MNIKWFFILLVSVMFAIYISLYPAIFETTRLVAVNFDMDKYSTEIIDGEVRNIYTMDIYAVPFRDWVDNYRKYYVVCNCVDVLYTPLHIINIAFSNKPPPSRVYFDKKDAMKFID